MATVKKGISYLVRILLYYFGKMWKSNVNDDVVQFNNVNWSMFNPPLTLQVQSNPEGKIHIFWILVSKGAGQLISC